MTRHKILNNGQTIPLLQDEIKKNLFDEVKISRVKLNGLNKARRKELGYWLSSRLGKPDCNNGFWWAEETREWLLIYFRNDEAFVQFSLIYGQY